MNQDSKLCECVAVAFTMLDGGAACRLDDIEQSLAALLFDEVADELTEAMDIFTQRLLFLCEKNLAAADGCRGCPRHRLA